MYQNSRNWTWEAMRSYPALIHAPCPATDSRREMPPWRTATHHRLCPHISRRWPHDLGRISRVAHCDRAASQADARPRRAVVGWQGRLEAGARVRPAGRRGEGSWVHAYLHRKEGDQSNAAYWYSRAGKSMCQEPLDAEWLSIVTALVKAT